MSGVYRALAARPGVEFRLLVGGTHLSPAFGQTADMIAQDGLPVLCRLPGAPAAGTRAARINAAAALMSGMAEALAADVPDVLVYAGDREDALVAAMTAAYMRIPGAHFFGGDHAIDGNVDNAARHAAAKLSSFHLVSHPEHRERLLRIGESPERIHVIGSPALDKFRTERHMTRAEVFAALDAAPPASEPYAVLIHHPMIGREGESRSEFEAALRAVRTSGVRVFVGFPNSDSGFNAIMDAIDLARAEDGVHVYGSISRESFVNLLRHAAFVIGNSSLGYLEAASIPLPVINVGPRQQGRIPGPHIVTVSGDEAEIRRAVAAVLSPCFRTTLSDLRNPYGDGHSVDRAVELLASMELSGKSAKFEDPLKVCR